MPISRETVIKGFKLYLGREPESEAVIQSHMTIRNEATLAKVLLSSEEYLRNHPEAVQDNPPTAQQTSNEQTAGEMQAESRLPAPALSARMQAVFRRLGLHQGRKSGPNEVAQTQLRTDVPHFASSALKVTIFGNCQAYGIAKLMQAMTGDVIATAVESTSSVIAELRSGQLDAAAMITGSDIIFVQEIGAVLNLIRERFPADFHKVRQFPCVNFSAYHPDLVYVTSSKQSGWLQGPLGDYQSAIALCGWLEGLSAKETVSLFRGEVFDALGYYDYWDTSAKILVEAGKRTAFDISDLLEQWQRTGCWLHSVNHPKLFVLADVARRLLGREGIATLPGVEGYVVDGFISGPAWPVYPEIGKRLGVSGNYYFKRLEGLCPPEKPVLMLGLEDFVSESYALFEQHGRENLKCERVGLPRYQNLKRFIGVSDGAASSVVQAPLQPPVATAPSGSRSPYAGLPDYRFWRRAIERVPLQEVDPVIRAGFALKRSDRVATAGSCFAQHISSSLRQHGFEFFVTERGEQLSKEEAARRQYGVFSARYGNLYTTRQLVQLFDRAYGYFKPVDSHWLRDDGKLVDAFRPQVEPDGFASLEALERSRSEHYSAVREMFEKLDVFVFTLGLTEAWRSLIDGAVYPLAPGVVAGEMNASRYEFVNFRVHEVIEDLRSFLKRLRGVNANARMIVTVSPVPLIATYEDRHVLVSNTASKSVLRTAADEFARGDPLCDYFPSYEIIIGNYNFGQYFESDLRSVKAVGVQHVMRLFLAHYAAENEKSSLDEELTREAAKVRDIICDEEAIDGGAIKCARAG